MVRDHSKPSRKIDSVSVAPEMSKYELVDTITSALNVTLPVIAAGAVQVKFAGAAFAVLADCVIVDCAPPQALSW